MSIRKLLPVLLMAAVMPAACSELPEDVAGPIAVARDVVAIPVPLANVSFAVWHSELWPFTGNAVTAAATDPINVIFPNRDAREIRASLMFLDGDRTAFGMPDAPPFNCTWKDAVGDPQSGYTTESGWTASAIQLECGDYAPIRFHLRLFPAGTSTIANGHFEVIIPGTNEHEVLSWEVAEALVKVDFLRSGLLDPAAPLGMTQVINPAPTYRSINPLVYNGLPVSLRGLISGPLGNVAAPVPIWNDGRAVILNLASAIEGDREVVRRRLTIDFNQTIPKPFCSQGALDYLRVVGTIVIDQTIMSKPRGAFTSRFHARGSLEVTPINPLTGATGTPYKAVINEQQRNVLTDEKTLVTMLRLQKLITDENGVIGMLSIRAELGSGGPEATVAVGCNQSE